MHHGTVCPVQLKQKNMVSNISSLVMQPNHTKPHPGGKPERGINPQGPMNIQYRSLEIKLFPEHIHIHPCHDLIGQVSPTHLAKHPPQGVIQVRALVLADMQHALELLVIDVITPDNFSCTLPAFLLNNAVH